MGYCGSEGPGRGEHVVDLPTGTVTFLFTDIEGSTRLWEEQPDAMQVALAHHDALLVDAVEACGGTVVKTTGDGVHAVFPVASEGVYSALKQAISRHTVWCSCPPGQCHLEPTDDTWSCRQNSPLL